MKINKEKINKDKINKDKINRHKTNKIFIFELEKFLKMMDYFTKDSKKIINKCTKYL
jgi:hypothetical protein